MRVTFGVLVMLGSLLAGLCKLAYFSHIIINSRLESGPKVLWLIGLLVFGDLLLPVYCFKEILPHLPASQAPRRSSAFGTMTVSVAQASRKAPVAEPPKVQEIEAELREETLTRQDRKDYRRRPRKEMRRPRRESR